MTQHRTPWFAGRQPGPTRRIVGTDDDRTTTEDPTPKAGRAVKRISAWAAILFAPTLIGTVYGMNFANMPELGWEFGYPFAIGLMLLVSGILFLIFRRRGWL